MLHFALGDFHQYVKVIKNGDNLTAQIERPTIEQSWYNQPLQSVGTIFNFQVSVAWNPQESTIRVDWLPVVIF
jgi:hypothetical protein